MVPIAQFWTLKALDCAGSVPDSQVWTERPVEVVTSRGAVTVRSFPVSYFAAFLTFAHLAF
jgi:hypothetical protein